MSLEELADKSVVWEAAVKKLLKSFAAIGAAIGAVLMPLIMWWPFNGDTEPQETVVIENWGYSPQCSQLFNTINWGWSEEQWSKWETLRKDMRC
jgi:hypothetical protein|tara:strand:+ start:64 stop:345 length:282 start_codon:yes stop_codon:yes gene_type:complete